MKAAVVFTGKAWILMEGLTQSTMELVKIFHEFKSAQDAAFDLEPEHIYYHTSEDSFKRGWGDEDNVIRMTSEEFYTKIGQPYVKK
jgi:hypothetical protein